MATAAGVAESGESGESDESGESGESGGSVGVSARPGRPIGVSPQVRPLTAGTTTWWPGDRWPPDHSGAGWGRMPDTTRFMQPLVAGGPYYFPQQVWGPDYWATVILADFVSYVPAAAGDPVAWNAVLNDPADSFLTVGVGTNFPNFATATAMLDAELQELVALIPYRASVQAEILSQKDSMLQYFNVILSFNLRTHPATVFLCTAALRIGSFQAMYYKNIFNRARPSRFSPDLMPLIDPPGHASYPSGHATQARLIALCLEQVMPGAIIPVAAPPPPPPPLLDPVAELSPLRMMAGRIARNREVAGVHFPSDSLIGKKLADGSFSIMMERPAVNDLITAARLEWAPRA